MTIEGSARGVRVDADRRELVVSDDSTNRVRFFRLPITADPPEEGPWLSAGQFSVGMGPVLVASDRERWLSGRTEDAAAIDIYTDRSAVVDAPTARAVFVRDPQASTDALHRIGRTRALALFHRRTDGSDSHLPTWVTVFDFAEPLTTVVGTKAVAIGDERVFRSRLDDDGSVWVALSLAGKIVHVTAP